MPAEALGTISADSLRFLDIPREYQLERQISFGMHSLKAAATQTSCPSYNVVAAMLFDG
jgi:hypothetical protein